MSYNLRINQIDIYKTEKNESEAPPIMTLIGIKQINKNLYITNTTAAKVLHYFKSSL